MPGQRSEEGNRKRRRGSKECFWRAV
jgi:hypothetical protein